MISGNPIKDFSGGWALFSFWCDKAHNWSEIPAAEKTDGTQSFKARCGIQGITTKWVPALERGGFPKCKRCMK